MQVQGKPFCTLRNFRNKIPGYGSAFLSSWFAWGTGRFRARVCGRRVLLHCSFLILALFQLSFWQNVGQHSRGLQKMQEHMPKQLCRELLLFALQHAGRRTIPIYPDCGCKKESNLHRLEVRCVPHLLRNDSDCQPEWPELTHGSHLWPPRAALSAVSRSRRPRRACSTPHVQHAAASAPDARSRAPAKAAKQATGYEMMGAGTSQSPVQVDRC